MPCCCGKKTWTRSLKELNHVLFVTQYFMSRHINSQKCSARPARTDSTLIVSLNGSEVVARVLAYCASNHGAGRECNESLIYLTVSLTKIRASCQIEQTIMGVLELIQLYSLYMYIQEHSIRAIGRDSPCALDLSWMQFRIYPRYGTQWQVPCELYSTHHLLL